METNRSSSVNRPKNLRNGADNMTHRSDVTPTLFPARVFYSPPINFRQSEVFFTALPPATAYSFPFSLRSLSISLSLQNFPPVVFINLLNQLISLRRIVHLFFFFLLNPPRILSTFAVEPFIAAGCSFQCHGRCLF